MDLQVKRWLKIPIFNLLLVASIGVILRYKIAFSLPFVDQKYLLHGHSHFAFSGWVTQVLMVLMVAYLAKRTGKDEFASYKWLLIANLLTAYGMLFTFPFQGYGLFSITFSTLSVFTSYVFSVRFWRDLNKIPGKDIRHHWFKAALFYNVVSSIGTFALAYMMANKIIHQNWYLAAVYFYLHFQYNGWFFFACMGLFHDSIHRYAISIKTLNIIFWSFAFACVPAYLLSTLWMQMPVLVYIIVVVASFVQVIAWGMMGMIILKLIPSFKKDLSRLSLWLLCLSALALTVKLLLQLGSTIPSLSQLAFGFRPIVVAYLHLVLLGVISLFILGYIFSMGQLKLNKMTYSGAFIFTTGVILNEVVLMLEGIAGFSYNSIPYSDKMLLGMALIMFTGILMMLIPQLRKEK